MAGKAPAFQFYPGDWIQDTRILTPLTRGIWIDMLCFMWRSSDRGKIEGTQEQLARMLSCTAAEIDVAIKELSVTQVAEISECNDFVTVTNRRMFHEERVRKQTAYRVKRFRNAEVKRESNASVTHASSSSSSLSSMISLNSSDPVTPNNGHVPHQEILALWCELMPDKPQPKAWPAERQALLRSRWHEDQKRQCLEYWERLFRYIRGSPFLMGEEQSPGRKPFVVTLPWLLKKANFLNTIERKYHT